MWCVGWECLCATSLRCVVMSHYRLKHFVDDGWQHALVVIGTKLPVDVRQVRDVRS